jgi:hypothetical protein
MPLVVRRLDGSFCPDSRPRTRRQALPTFAALALLLLLVPGIVAGCNDRPPRTPTQIKACEAGKAIMTACYASAATETCGAVRARAVEATRPLDHENVRFIRDKLLEMCADACARRKENKPFDPGRVDCNEI